MSFTSKLQIIKIKTGYIFPTKLKSITNIPKVPVDIDKMIHDSQFGKVIPIKVKAMILAKLMIMAAMSDAGVDPKHL